MVLKSREPPPRREAALPGLFGVSRPRLDCRSSRRRFPRSYEYSGEQCGLGAYRRLSPLMSTIPVFWLTSRIGYLGAAPEEAVRWRTRPQLADPLDFLALLPLGALPPAPRMVAKR